MRYPTPSQLGQDSLVLAVLNDMRNGVFVEIGVGQGRHMSNTYLLETEFGWTGLLVEPNPDFHSQILASRHNAILEPVAAYSKTGLALNFILANEVSTIYEFKDADCYNRHGPVIVVETMTMNDILEKHGIEHIDYLSLDTEGSELHILQGLDLHRYRPMVVNIEHNHTSAEELIKTHMQMHGYAPVLEHRSSWDTWFIRL